MELKVREYIARHNLLDINQLHLVALSGGADSVALLLVLHALGYQLEAIHCNFHLRNAESDRDERFSEKLCLSKNIPFHRVHFDTLVYAEAHHVSIELAARELRYRYFEQLRYDLGAASICVAHHKDDSVETVLMNLIRGTGIRGLAGIKSRNGNVVRPLLCVSRLEIEDYLRKRGQTYVTDSTNLSDDTTRNRVRHHLIPLLRELNPAVTENICRMMHSLSEADAVLQTVFSKYENLDHLDINQLDVHGSREYLLFEWLKNYGFNGGQILQLMDSMETGRIFSSATHDLLVNRDKLIVAPRLKQFSSMVLPETGIYVLSDGRRLCLQKVLPYVSRNKNVATVDFNKVKFPLRVKTVEAGDRMRPYGMQGSQLLSDMMTNQKMSVFEKRLQLLVVDATGVIIWAVGLRIDARVAVTESTNEVLEIAISN